MPSLFKATLRLLLISALLPLFLTCGTSQRATLDTTFGSGGKLSVDFAGGDDRAAAVLFQDNKIIVVGSATNKQSNTDFAIARLNADGTLDTSFNGTGKVMTDIQNGSQDTAFAAALQTDKKLVVAGGSSSGGVSKFAVARYNTDGSLDTTFNGSGIFTYAVGANFDEAHALQILSSGEMVVGGISKNGSGNGQFAMILLTTSGALSSTFTSQPVKTTIGSGSASVYGLGVQNDGKIVLMGYSQTTLQNDYTITRYNKDGTQDLNYGTGLTNAGITTQDFASLIPPASVSGGTSSTDDYAYTGLLTSTGFPILAGNSNDGTNDLVTMARFDTNGHADTAFGANANGLVAVQYPPGSTGTLPTNSSTAKHIFGRALTQSTNGTLYLAGYTPTTTNNQPAVIHFDQVGHADLSFGNHGVLVQDFGGTNAEAYGIGIQSDGKVVIVGRVVVGTGWDFMLMRFLP